MSAPTHSLCTSPVAPAAVVHAPSPRHLEVGLGVVVVVVELVEGGAGVAIRRRASVSSGAAREARAEARRAQQHDDDGEDDADGERRVECLLCELVGDRVVELVEVDLLLLHLAFEGVDLAF